MNVKKKILPVICLVSAYVHWIKPRLLPASASKSGKSLLLNLCARSRFFIPIMVFTAFWLFDTHMQIEASITFTYNNDVQAVVDAAEEEVEVEINDEDYDADDDADDDDDDDDNDGVDNSIDSYSDISSSSDVSLIVLEDLDVALQEYVNNDNDNIAIRHSVHHDHHEQ